MSSERENTSHNYFKKENQLNLIFSKQFWIGWVFCFVAFFLASSESVLQSSKTKPEELAEEISFTAEDLSLLLWCHDMGLAPGRCLNLTNCHQETKERFFILPILMNKCHFLCVIYLLLNFNDLL